MSVAPNGARGCRCGALAALPWTNAARTRVLPGRPFTWPGGACRSDARRRVPVTQPTPLSVWCRSVVRVLQGVICDSAHDARKMLLCDGCDKGHHIFCLKPALTKIPRGDWHCAECVAPSKPKTKPKKRRRTAEPDGAAAASTGEAGGEAVCGVARKKRSVTCTSIAYGLTQVYRAHGKQELGIKDDKLDVWACGFAPRLSSVEQDASFV